MNRTALSDLRRQKRPGLTLEDLSRRLRCSGVALSRFETGVQDLSPAKRRQYAAALGISLSQADTLFLLARLSYGERVAGAARAALAGAATGAGRRLRAARR